MKHVQEALIELGYLDARYLTGFYGPLTMMAFQEFQADNGLAPTGILDKETKERLAEAV